MAPPPVSQKLIKQVNFLLLNKELYSTDIARILSHNISVDVINKIKRNSYKHFVSGHEPPDDYENYLKNYVYTVQKEN